MARPWTPEQDRYLLVNHDKYDLSFLARVLDRSVVAVRRRLLALQRGAASQELNAVERFVTERAQRIGAKAARTQAPSVVDRTGKLSKWTGKGNPYAQTKTGYRPDLGIVCRSGWEANVLRVLSAHGIAWEFEPKIFIYPVKRGNKGYTPDIFLSTTDEWIEIKGYLDKNSEVKLKRFKKYYPEEFARLTMVIGRSSKKAREFCESIGVPTVLYYEDFSKKYKAAIPSWEGR